MNFWCYPGKGVSLRLPHHLISSLKPFFMHAWGEGKMDSFTLKTVYRVQPDEMINMCSCGCVITYPQEHVLII